jgi:TM2 domain-containing membrane protein YozV
MVDDSATSCPNCNSTAFRPGPSSQPQAQVTYNIYHAGHPGYQPPAQPMPPMPPPYQPPFQHPYHQPAAHPYAQFVPTVSDKSRTVALVLLLAFGGAGIHRFYVGKVGTGILMLICALLAFTIVLLPILCIWLLVDLILILGGNFKDANGLPLKNW